MTGAKTIAICLLVLAAGVARSDLLGRDHHTNRMNDAFFKPNKQVLHTAEVPVKIIDDMAYVYVSINGVNMPFLIDSGASVMCLPDTYIGDLRKRGLLNKEDIKAPQNTVMADGRVVRSQFYNLKSVSIAVWDASDVEATSCGKAKVPLLGQALLSRFNSWSLDNKRSVLSVTAWVDK